MEINNKTFAVLIFLLMVNSASFLVMYLDKRRSKKVGAERIPEGLMFFTAAAFGSLGVLGGMMMFRHKTAKWYFALGVPLLMVQNSATLYVTFYLLFK